MIDLQGFFYLLFNSEVIRLLGNNPNRAAGFYLLELTYLAFMAKKYLVILAKDNLLILVIYEHI